jgi:hypothetical protein
MYIPGNGSLSCLRIFMISFLIFLPSTLMDFHIGIKLFFLRLRQRPTSTSDDIPVIHETRITQPLPVLIQMLTIAERAAGITTIPGLKGAIGTTLSILECVQVGDRRGIVG